MFGFIRKKELTNILKYLKKEYEHSNSGINDFYYSCGNINSVNYISHKFNLKI